MSFRRKEKSSQETLQRLGLRFGATNEDFSLRRNDKTGANCNEFKPVGFKTAETMFV